MSIDNYIEEDARVMARIEGCTGRSCKHCGSSQFNLRKEGIDQGDRCDVHYWKIRALKAEMLNTIESKVWQLRALGWKSEDFAEALKKII